MTEVRHFEFLATKSKELIQKQVDSYRQLHSYAATIIGVTALFIPFFIKGIDDSYPIINLLSLVPIGFLVAALLMMLSIFRTRSLDQAFSVENIKT